MCLSESCQTRSICLIYTDVGLFDLIKSQNETKKDCFNIGSLGMSQRVTKG